jgi:hypothetical protein
MSDAKAELYGTLYLKCLDGGLYEVEQRGGDEFFVIVGNGKHFILPPEGMKTDLGSIPQIFQWLVLKDKYNKAYIPHDAAYFYRYSFVPNGERTEKHLRLAAECCHIMDEATRITRMGELFRLVEIESRHTADAWLDDIIYTISEGNAKFDRLLIAGGLWLGSWGPWYFQKFKSRVRYIHRHPAINAAAWLAQ